MTQEHREILPQCHGLYEMTKPQILSKLTGLWFTIFDCFLEALITWLRGHQGELMDNILSSVQMGTLIWPAAAMEHWPAGRPNSIHPEAACGSAPKHLSAWHKPQGCTKPQEIWPEKVPASLGDFLHGASLDCSVPRQDEGRSCLSPHLPIYALGIMHRVLRMLCGHLGTSVGALVPAPIWLIPLCIFFKNHFFSSLNWLGPTKYHTPGIWNKHVS